MYTPRPVAIVSMSLISPRISKAVIIHRRYATRFGSGEPPNGWDDRAREQHWWNLTKFASRAPVDPVVRQLSRDWQLSDLIHALPCSPFEPWTKSSLMMVIYLSTRAATSL